MGNETEEPRRGGIEFGPAPATFDMSSFVQGGRDPRALSARGVCHWLSHAQSDQTGAQPVHTHRSVVQVTGSDGLQTAARMDVVFDPHHEHLVVHAVRVHRNGSVRDACVPEAFQLIQRELNLERAVYDGRMTAHMTIPDVREGDVVETAYSIVGANPVLRGLFSWWFVLQWSDPVVETRCTLRAAPDRLLTIRKFGCATDPVETRDGAVRVLDWRAVDLPPYVPEPRSPSSYVGYASVQVADRLTWSQVADVFHDLYQPAPDLPADLAEAVARISASQADPAARAVQGLRLVQESLRYHSVSVGDGGYRPRPVETIWRARYGDCKDASVTLTAVLRALGLQADCALVNTTIGDDLPHAPPNVTAFDHCIVRARVGDRSFWLDPTSPPQAGDLAHLTQADFHHALPLVRGAALETMPRPRMETVCETEEVWTFARRETLPADLVLTTTYRGWRADGMRRWIANEGEEGVRRKLREGLEGELRSPLRELSPFERRDDPRANVLTLTERYEVERPYVREEGNPGLLFQSRDDVVGPTLPPIGPDRRREPLALGTPRRVDTVRVLNFPVPMKGVAWRKTLDGPAGLRVQSSLAWPTRTQGRHMLSVEAPESVLPAARAEDYRDFETRAMGLNGVSFAVHFRNGKMIKSRRNGTANLNWFVWFAIVGGLALLRWLTMG